MQFKEFREALKKDAALNAGLEAFLESKAPESAEAKCAAIIEFAAAKGYTVTVEELSAEAAACRALDDEELRSVSGGTGTKQCQSSYIEGELCWSNDFCVINTNIYTNEDNKHENCRTTYDESVICHGSDKCDFGLIHYDS